MTIGTPPALKPAPRRLWTLRVAAVLLPLVALAAIGERAWVAVLAEARGRVTRAADMLHEHALRAFESQELAIAASESRLGQLSWDDVAGSREIYDFLTALDAVTPAAGGVTLVAPGGQLALSSSLPFPPPPLDLSARDFVTAHPAGAGLREAPFIGAVLQAQPSTVLAFPMSRPRRRPDGLADGGVILAALWPSYFQAFYRAVMESPQDAVTLFRLDGAVLAAVPEPTRPIGATLPPRVAPLLVALRRGPVPVVHGPSPVDGVPRLTAFRRLVGHDVAVAYGLSMAALQGDWRQRMLGPLVGAVLAMCLLGALTWRAERAMQGRAIAEARSRSAERQATLGLLAGGLAHDVGNITQSVMAAATLLAKHAENAERVRQIAAHLGRHAARATALSRRMLDTTRRNNAGTPRGTPVDVSDSLREVAVLLDLTLGAGLRVRCEVPPGLRAAPGIDRAELETALINLAANARDAMPGGGTVRISAARVTVPPRLADAPHLPEGAYLRISVADTGHGMEAATLARLGEPFFTTKAEGYGTGLGLAMVAAFLRNNGGTIAAESEPGRGSTIHLLLPAG